MATGIKRKANLNKGKIDTMNVVAKVPFIPNATIYTPITTIYDDGINPEQRCGFTLFDQNNKEVLTVRPSIMDPVKLCLKEGKYIVKLNGQKNPVYMISVLDNQFQQSLILYLCKLPFWTFSGKNCVNFDSYFIHTKFLPLFYLIRI